MQLGFGVSSLSGSVGGTTASIWKGQAYLRNRVTPANPKSAAQILQRDAMARMVRAWQTLIADTTTAWNNKASGKKLSGFNEFTKANVVQERTDYFRDIVPSNPDSNSIGTYAVAAGGGPGEIDVTWVQGGAGATDVVQFYYKQTGITVDGGLTDDGTETAQTLTHAITGLSSAVEYAVYAYVKDANGVYSTGYVGVATTT